MLRQSIILYVLYFLSGTAGLVYEILWMRYVQLLFGNTAKAAATVLAVFFLGMALGSAFGGRRAQRVKNPLRSYGRIELGIALAAAPVPFLPALYEAVLPAAFFFESSFFLDLARFILATAMMLPASVLIGATFPMMGAAAVTDRGMTGRSTALLYGLNTLGAACGVALTGFYLPAAVGIWQTYALALTLNLLLGLGIMAWTRRGPAVFAQGVAADATPLSRRQMENPVDADKGFDRILLGMAFGSGAILIALEVLWTRMFVLIFQNSVYSFSAIVLTVLIGIALGALLVAWLAPRLGHPMRFLGVALGLAAIHTLLIPLIFLKATGMTYFAYAAGWPAYLFQAMALIAGLLLLPAVLASATLPLLWQGFHRKGRHIAHTLGTVNFWNLLGAITGAAAAGFVLIPAAGLWGGLTVLSALLLALSQLAFWSLPSGSKRWAAVSLVLFVVAAFGVSEAFDYRVQHLGEGQRLLYLDEGEDAVVSVVEDPDGVRWLKSNNTYRLGATTGVQGEKRLGHLPLLLHPRPKSAAFIGIGTGISMSAGLDHALDALVGVEILPGALDAMPYFSEQNGDLLKDPRVKVAVGDGRVYLRTADQRFDVIVSDLFVPWHAGAGSLYTREHFQAVRGRLRPGGLFCQWLPLYQMSEKELGVIARTFAAVFPHVSIWRGDFSTNAPILGLVGTMEPIALDEAALGARLAALSETISPQDLILRSLSDLILLYAGDLASIAPWLSGFPLNTDNKPVVEFSAPISQSRRESVSGPALSAFYKRIQDAPAVSPVRVRPAQKSREDAPLSPLAGNLLFLAMQAGERQDGKTQSAAVKRAAELLPDSNVLNLMQVALSARGKTATRGLPRDGLK